MELPWRRLAGLAAQRNAFHIDGAGGNEDAHGDGQIEERPLLADVGGGEVDGDAAHERLIAAVGDRGGDAVLALAHGRVGESDRDDLRIAAHADVRLDLDRERLDPEHRTRDDLRQRHAPSLQMETRQKQLRQW